MPQHTRNTRKPGRLQPVAPKRKLPWWRAAAALAVVAAVVVGVTLASGQRSAPAGISISIVSPADGAQARSPVSLRFAVSGATLGLPQTGADHLHYSVDGGPVQALYAESQASLAVAPGQHTIYANVGGPDHQPLGPQTQTTFTVAP